MKYRIPFVGKYWFTEQQIASYVRVPFPFTELIVYWANFNHFSTVLCLTFHVPVTGRPTTDNENEQPGNALNRKKKLTLFKTAETRMCFLAFTRYWCILVCVFFLFSYSFTWLLQVIDVSGFKIILAAHNDVRTPPAFDLPENWCFV